MKEVGKDLIRPVLKSSTDKVYQESMYFTPEYFQMQLLNIGDARNADNIDPRNADMHVMQFMQLILVINANEIGKGYSRCDGHEQNSF